MNAQIAALDEEIALGEAEVGVLRHIDDDARRDALVSDNAEDRQIARMTRKDVDRAERYVAKLRRDRSALVRKREKAIDRLARS